MRDRSRIWVFSDLDDTLMQTARKMPAGVNGTPAAMGPDGAPHSFATPQQKTLLDLFQRGGATVIPVTGRTQRAYERHLFHLDIFGDFSILSHGAMVIDKSGGPSQEWLDRLNAEYDLKEWEALLDNLQEAILSAIHSGRIPLRAKVLWDNKVPVYVSIKNNPGSEPNCEPHFIELAKVIAKHMPEGVRLHVNDRNMAILPPYASKAEAVRFVAKQLQIRSSDLVLGLGDSLTDLPFIRTTHFGLFPMGSQIDARLK